MRNIDGKKDVKANRHDRYDKLSDGTLAGPKGPVIVRRQLKF